MDINQKMLLDLAARLGIEDQENSRVQEAANIADYYKDKDEEDLLKEILKLKQGMKGDSTQFRKQLQAIKSLRSMMNKDQQERLERILYLLERD